MLAGLTIVVLGGEPLRAQSETFRDRTSVVEVQVPVHVMGKDGQPVRGLGIDDFAVLDGGDPRAIRSFRVVDLDVLSPDPTHFRAVEDAVPPAARRHFLFLFDLSFSSRGSVLRARQAAQRFVVESLHPTDLAAVATHSIEAGTQLVITFTPDRAQLARAIDTLGAPALLHGLNDPLRFVIDLQDHDAYASALDANAPETPSAALEAVGHAGVLRDGPLDVVGAQMGRAERSYQRGQISRWAESLGSMARVLGSIEGTKQVVYFTEGFDGRLVWGRQPDRESATVERDKSYFMLNDTDDTLGHTPLQNEIRLMLDELRRTDTVLQVVDISGLRSGLAAGARHQQSSDVLFTIADQTGGRLYQDSNDFGAQLTQVLESSALTYLLTIDAADVAADGRYHRLQVRVNAGKDARVSHRAGYYAPRPFADLHPLERNLLAADLIASAVPRRDLALSVLAAPFRASEQSAYVPVIVEVGGASLLVEHPEKPLTVEIYAYATDERGEMKDFFAQVITLALHDRRQAFERTGLKYYGHLELTPGAYLIRVLVRNAVTGRTGVESWPLEIPPMDRSRPQLLPPFFAEPPGTWFLAKEPSSDYAKATVYPFTVNGEPYVPAAVPMLSNDVASDLCLVAYDLPAGDLELTGRVITADGAPLTGARLRLRERTVTGIRGFDKLLVAFTPEGLPAGDYRLEVRLDEAPAHQGLNASAPFRIGPRSLGGGGP